jgi:hypothetical protein
MHHVGDDGRLAVISVEETIRNPGPGEVSFLGYSLTVLASKLIPLSTAQAAKAQSGQNELEAYYAFSRPVPVFREAYVTALGDPTQPHGLFVQPGQTTTLTREFYVPRRRFDHLSAWVVGAYVGSTKPQPTTLVIGASGLPVFKTPDSTSIYSFKLLIAELDLKSQ